MAALDEEQGVMTLDDLEQHRSTLSSCAFLWERLYESSGVVHLVAGKVNPGLYVQGSTRGASRRPLWLHWTKSDA